MNPQLNEWGLPGNTPPHNPDNLTPEQITEGGAWRATTEDEAPSVPFQYWRGPSYGWCNHPALEPDVRLYSAADNRTFRVPITTPLPAVKESLTPQTATGQSKTPRTDAECANNGIGLPLPHVRADFARQLEHELNAARAREAEARALLERAKLFAESTITREYRFINDTEEDSSKEQKDFIGSAESTLTAINTHLKL